MTGNERREESRDQYRPIFIEDPREAREEILALWEDRIGPDCRRLVDEAMADVELLFAGGVPGYRESNTPYHTLGHTVMVFIAMGRILNGAVHDGIDLSSEEVTAGLLAVVYRLLCQGEK